MRELAYPNGSGVGLVTTRGWTAQPYSHRYCGNKHCSATSCCDSLEVPILAYGRRCRLHENMAHASTSGLPSTIVRSPRRRSLRRLPVLDCPPCNIQCKVLTNATAYFLSFQHRRPNLTARPGANRGAADSSGKSSSIKGVGMLPPPLKKET